MNDTQKKYFNPSDKQINKVKAKKIQETPNRSSKKTHTHSTQRKMMMKKKMEEKEELLPAQLLDEVQYHKTKYINSSSIRRRE